MYLCDTSGLRLAHEFWSNSLRHSKENVYVTYHNEDFSAEKMRNKDVSQIESIAYVHLETEMGWF